MPGLSKLAKMYISFCNYNHGCVKRLHVQIIAWYSSAILVRGMPALVPDAIR